MARDILSERGPRRPRKVETCGGVKPGYERDVHNYRPPTGPTSINNRKVGLGGDNHGTGTQGTYEHMTGSPGLGGKNLGQGVNRRG